jgi:hypothetical protein
MQCVLQFLKKKIPKSIPCHNILKAECCMATVPRLMTFFNCIVAVVGSCLFPYGLKQGELCRRDNDCETGLLCTEAAGEGRTCQPPTSNKKQYSEYEYLQHSSSIFCYFNILILWDTFLECDSVSLGKQFPTFWGTVMPSTSGSIIPKSVIPHPIVAPVGNIRY